MDVSFKTTSEETASIAKIADRAAALGMLGRHYSRMTLLMDLSACHANGCPLDFARMADADDANLAHDVAGIANHLDRETGKLTGHFLPRFHRHEQITA